MARHELWVELADRPGNLAALAGDLAACGANIVHLDVHAGPGDTVIDRLVVQVPDARGHELAAVADRCGATLRELDAAGSPTTRGATAGGAPVSGGARPRPRAAGASPSPADEHHRRRPPMTLERLVALTDGGLVRLRHLSAGDRNGLRAHHERCSEATRQHSRFLALWTVTSPAAGGDAAEAAGGATADDAPAARGTDGGGGRGGERVALAALVGGDIAGVARYDVDEARTVARMAVVVEDRHQRRGIGALLVNELAVLAANADVRRLRAVAPTGGDRLARTLRRAGLEFTVRRDGDALVLDCGLPHGLSASA
jgi:GNAT superfamily N-acetyltransferase